jgi:hypothetical protein
MTPLYSSWLGIVLSGTLYRAFRDGQGRTHYRAFADTTIVPLRTPYRAFADTHFSENLLFSNIYKPLSTA